MNHARVTQKTGWLGHREISRPAMAPRECHPGNVDWLDCLLAVWIAEAMLDEDSGAIDCLTDDARRPREATARANLRQSQQFLPVPNRPALPNRG